jgi:iron complex outermembrane receptor protein
VDQVIGYAPNGWPSGFEQVKVEFDQDVLPPKTCLVYRPLEGLSLYGRFARATRIPDNPAF